MISRWKVLQCVAERYGGKQEIFEQAHDRLESMRQNNQSPIMLEENDDRKRLRVAREMDTVIGLERIAGTIDFQDVYVFDMLSRLSKSVCRITLGSRPIGTGFLVAENVIITNHHVIENPAAAQEMFAEFDYEFTPPPDSTLAQKSIFKLNASVFFLTSSLAPDPADPNSGLDFTLIGVDTESVSGTPLSAYVPIQLDGNSGKIIKGESCIIIQHPDGKPKKVVLKNTAFFSETESRIVYETDTLPGSSGAMVVALGTCEVIALHHAGLPRTDSQNRILTKAGTFATSSTPDDEIDWIGNEGIKISRIIQALESAKLPAGMEQIRKTLLGKTKTVASHLTSRMRDIPDSMPVISPHTNETNSRTTNIPVMDNATGADSNRTDFLVTAMNSVQVTTMIEAILTVKYGPGVLFHLAMPGSASEGHIELFRLQINIRNSPEAEEKELLSIPGILNAEADMPLAVNADSSMVENRVKEFGVESGLISGDGFGKENEDEFLDKYTRKEKSQYVFDKEKDEYRMWNWEATGFHRIVKSPDTVSPREKGIRIVQFDTGYSDHPKVLGGFDLDHDLNFLDEDDPTDARDLGTSGFLKQPGHGARTGSLLIGNKETLISTNGNAGLLVAYDYKLTPFRISESVILINRQHQLARALDSAITQGFDIITMSMGLPPTIATAKMAKKAYEKGVIWCCAAGNEVQFVVAPAVFPGSIAVAASNPMDREWPSSSRGDAVNITAPGQDVYVPIIVKDPDGKLRDGFSYGDGTSYATPHVAAAAAYWLAKYQPVLNSPEYRGWKRVEAFRQALKESARRKNQLPTKGFGSGMLDIEKLLATEPLPANELEFAYNNWNDNAFFATLQGLGQIGKTFWNKFHGLIFGVRRGGQESLAPQFASPSSAILQLETALFGTQTLQNGRFESIGASVDVTSERMRIINERIISSAKK